MLMVLFIFASVTTATRGMVMLSSALTSERKMPKFHNADGSLTAYSFACGYIQTRKTDQPGGVVSLYKDGCWHVQARDDNRKRYKWETFPTLTEARKFFNKKSNF